MNDAEILTVEGLRALVKKIEPTSKFEPVTVSRESIDELRRSHVTEAVSALFGMPVLMRSDGNYRVIHPSDRAHLVEHDGGRPGCSRCWAIWGGMYR